MAEIEQKGWVNLSEHSWVSPAKRYSKATHCQRFISQAFIFSKMALPDSHTSPSLPVLVSAML